MRHNATGGELCMVKRKSVSKGLGAWFQELVCQVSALRDEDPLVATGGLKRPVQWILCQWRHFWKTHFARCAIMHELLRDFRAQLYATLMANCSTQRIDSRSSYTNDYIRKSSSPYRAPKSAPRTAYTTATEYLEVVRVALPVKGSVPACTSIKYRLELNPSLSMR